MILNEQNYFSIDNKYLSNSKINDWLKDKRYFYNRHVKGERDDKKSDILIIGSAVDTWLTIGRAEYERSYIPVERRSSKNPPIGYTEITPTMNEQIIGICESVERQSAYKQIIYKEFQSQKILQYDMDLGLFTGICGKPDWLLVNGDKAQIIDLKTTSNIDPLKYHYSCIEYGYYRQQAMYQILVEYVFGVKHCESYHLAVEKDGDGIYAVQTFKIDNDRLDLEKSKLFTILAEIKKEKDFAPRDISWDNAILLGSDSKQLQNITGINSLPPLSI